MMNDKLKCLIFSIALAFVGVFTVGCSVQEKAEKTVIVTEDVEKESSLADSSLKITRLDDVLGQEDAYEGFRKGFWGEKVYYNDGEDNNNFFVFDLKAGTTKMLIDDNKVFDMSTSANYALSTSVDYAQDFVHNLQSGEVFPLTHGSPHNTGYKFANIEGDEILSFNESTNTVAFESLETNKIQTWSMDDFYYMSVSSVNKVENKLFLIARSINDDYGVYQLKDQGEIDLVTHISGMDKHPLEVNFLKNNTALFNGRVDGKHGIYLLDFATGHLEELVPRGISTEGKRFPFPTYNLSPDESKIMFNTFVQVGEDYTSNVYIGELLDGKLVNTVRMLEDINLYSMSPFSGSWSKDSKIAYIDTWGKPEIDLETIAVFEVE